MSFDVLRGFALGVAFDTLGVPATVTLPNATVIQTTAIWMVPTLEDVPSGMELQRRQVRRVLALKKDDVAAVARGTLITLAERVGDPSSTWRVDEIDASEPRHVRVVVIPEES